ncbi:hypothetical protein HYFRA_00003331 [Hymenoscyphus fraxineus]|uniref:Interferon-related developmental regulator N-terminal domain-containing protein n=1 Tax=Hymenoscyphus fraxineus TaxID=746836 RepID=A0A9N9KUI9_9HELO|nr:hypothetical protein HYFRA_00003331 [Hymenoscyphus fraxineus]
MHDLRRQALESGKTVSRKAQSRISSRASSAANSRTNSRNASRHASDDEDTMSDCTNWSMNSLNERLAAEVPEDASEAWKEDLANRIEEIINRKRSSTQGRESALNLYVYYLMNHYAYDETRHKAGELFPAFLKSIKADGTEKETCLALRGQFSMQLWKSQASLILFSAIALTLITVPSETAYAGLFQPLKVLYTDSRFPSVKATAIHTLGAAAIFGGAADGEIEDIMDDLLEVIESDGSSVEAADIGEVVTAACQVWGFLATSVDDMEEKTEAAIEAFVEQLESTDTKVQVAVGQNIALLYEKSYTEREEGDGAAPAMERISDDATYEEISAIYHVEKSWVKRYEVYRQKYQLEQTLSQLATESSKRIGKKDRKTLHANFTDILHAVEHPTLGPRYSMARDKEGRVYGSRMTVKLRDFGLLQIDKWWKLHRFQSLKRILGGGFITHYEENEVVVETLPAILMNSDSDEEGYGASD